MALEGFAQAFQPDGSQGLFVGEGARLDGPIPILKAPPPVFPALNTPVVKAAPRVPVPVAKATQRGPEQLALQRPLLDAPAQLLLLDDERRRAEANRSFFEPGCQYCNCGSRRWSAALHYFNVCLTGCASACCGYCCAQRGTNADCPMRCDHRECIGRFGGRQQRAFGHRGARCILNSGHFGQCLCEAHAPTINIDLQIYRPLRGPY